jgi:2-aminoadipate transaminase
MRSAADYGVAAHVADAPPNVLRELIQLSLDRADLVSLAGGLPADELFDAAGLEAAAASVFRSNTRAHLQYNATDGLTSLREQLAALTAARGIEAEAGGIVVTSGSQQAIDIVTRCLVAPGDAVIVERPTFITALQTFRAAQAELLGVDSDGEGPIPEAVAAATAAAGREGRRVKLLYLVPTFSNPAGGVISLARRRALIDVAVRLGLTILEDDPYGELWFDRPPPPPLRALAEGEAAEHVIYISSLSKTVSPGLRIGWTLLPAPLLSPFKLMKSTADIHSSVVAQAIADAYLAQGTLADRVGLLRRGYARKAEALAAALRAATGDALSFEDPVGGMFLWARLSPELGLPALDLARRALAFDVSVVPGDPFYAGEPATDRLRLSFSQGSETRLAEGAARLAQAIAGAR